MAKLVSCVLVLVAAFFVVEGVNIPPPRLRSPGLFVRSSRPLQNVIPNDPRCKENGMFVNPNDCTSYYACFEGTSQDRKCPEGMKFDSRTHCTFEKADCGVSTFLTTGAGLTCPSDYGIYSYPSDCHKYIVCVDAVPSVRTCPDGQWYQSNVGCVKGDKCPSSSSSEREDGRRNQVTEVLEN